MADAPAAAPAAPITPPAPTAPAPTPAAPPATPSAPTASSRDPNLKGGGTETDAALDALSALYDEPQAQPAPNKGEATDPNAPPAKPAAPAKPAEPVKPAPAKTLREAKDLAEKRNKELEAELKTLREQRAAAPVDDPEKGQLRTQLETLNKRNQELEETVQFTAFERSDRYKQEFYKPFEDAYRRGMQKTASIKAADGQGGWRQGTDEDFKAIMRQQDDGMAGDMAAEMFGSNAAAVMYHRERVLELNARKEEALEHYRTEGVKRDTERLAAEKTQRETMAKEMGAAFDQAKREAMERFPKWFKPVEGDAEGNTLLEKGFSLTDEAFIGARRGADGKLVAIPPKELARIRATVHNKSGSWDRMALMNRRKDTRIKELETELAQYRDSEPKPGYPPRTRASEPKGSTMEQAWADMDKKVR